MSKVYKKGAKSIQVIRSTEQERIALINFLEYPICFEDPLLIDNISAWVEHIPFGLFIVDLLRPKTIVELGTHSGVSYSAFCQAVKKWGWIHPVMLLTLGREMRKPVFTELRFYPVSGHFMMNNLEISRNYFKTA